MVGTISGKRPRGVTLVELVLVLSLLGILVASTIPFVPVSIGRSGLESAVRRVRSDIHYARELALVTGVNHGIDFSSGQPYVVYRLAVGNPVADPLTQQAFSEDPLDWGGVQIMAPYRVEFDPLGRPVVGGGGSVSLSGGGGVRSVRVNANTGLVEVQ